MQVGALLNEVRSSEPRELIGIFTNPNNRLTDGCDITLRYFLCVQSHDDLAITHVRISQ
jgi:hypothetical protein